MISSVVVTSYFRTWCGAACCTHAVQCRYEFSDIALDVGPPASWDSATVHNPDTHILSDGASVGRCVQARVCAPSCCDVPMYGVTSTVRACVRARAWRNDIHHHHNNSNNNDDDDGGGGDSHGRVAPSSNTRLVT